jgi:hypothetical protein
MSELTYEKMRAMMDSLPKPEPDLFNPFRMPFRPLGRDLYIEPPPPAKIHVHQIFLKDGTPLLPEKFLAEQNAWWAAMFGYRDTLCKDHIFLLGSYGILCSPAHASILSMITN